MQITLSGQSCAKLERCRLDPAPAMEQAAFFKAAFGPQGSHGHDRLAAAIATLPGAAAE
jgi:hypothetical protein